MSLSAKFTWRRLYRNLRLEMSHASDNLVRLASGGHTLSELEQLAKAEEQENASASLVQARRDHEAVHRQMREKEARLQTETKKAARAAELEITVMPALRSKYADLAQYISESVEAVQKAELDMAAFAEAAWNDNYALQSLDNLAVWLAREPHLLKAKKAALESVRSQIAATEKELASLK